MFSFFSVKSLERFNLMGNIKQRAINETQGEKVLLHGEKSELLEERVEHRGQVAGSLGQKQ